MASLGETASPVTVVSSEEIAQSGTSTVEELLSRLPEVVPAASDATPGSSNQTLNLRGLGSSRTLLLVDGQRAAPGDSFTPAVSQIPIGLIDRVEVLKDGAGATYGSDAVAGVVNIVTRRDFEGFEAGGQRNFTANGGAQVTTDLAFGTNFAGGLGNFTLFGSYLDQQPLRQRTFDFSRISGGLYRLEDDTFERFGDPQAVPPGAFLVTPGGSDVTPWGTIRSGVGNPFRNLWIVLPQFNNVDHDCDPATPNIDVNGGTLSYGPLGGLQPFRGNGLCGIPDVGIGSTRYNDAVDYDFLSGANQYNVTGTTRFQFGGLITADLFGSWTRQETEVRSSPIEVRDIVVPWDSPLIPPDLRIALDERAVPNGSFFMDRRFSELGPRIDDYKTDYFNFRASLEFKLGDFLTLYTGGGYGRTETRLDVRNLVDGGALQDGLFDCFGGQPGCVPLDIFGSGTLTRPMIDSLRTGIGYENTLDRFWLKTEVYGSLFNLGSNAAQFRLGGEYREDGTEFRERPVDGFTGPFPGFEPLLPYEGEYDVREVFAEIRIPILSDTFFNELSLEVGSRYSDYNVGDNDLSAFTYDFGVDWAPVRDIRFRGSYTRAVRAPTIEELFSPTRVGTGFYSDPCNETNPERNEPACRETGIPDEFLDAFFQLGSTTSIDTGGNQDLEEEISDTWTVGTVIQPRFLPRLNITVDYYNIEIDNAITRIGHNEILNLCYDRNVSLACDRVERGPTGQLERIDATGINAGRIKSTGVDFSVDFTHELGSGLFGTGSQLSFDLRGTWLDELVREFEQPLFDVPFNFGCFLGQDCDQLAPEWRWNSSVSWATGPLIARFGWRHTTGFAIEDPFNGETLERVGSYDLFDLGFAFNVNDNLVVNTGVNNLFDKEPPITGFQNGRAQTYPGTYDVLGRDFFVSANLRF